MDILYTKKDFLDIFSTMGIDEGMVVLVQADLTGFNEILSGSQAIIEALQELVKEDGCIICQHLVCLVWIRHAMNKMIIRMKAGT